MSALPALILAALGWIAIVLSVRWVILPQLSRAPGDDPITWLLWYGLRIYCMLVHRVRLEGFEELRARQNINGGLIVVSNHTSAIDPLLIQYGCHFHIRWLMAADMMIPELDWLWKQQRIIPVMRETSAGADAGTERQDTAPVREAIRHVRAGGVIGIFPEGRIIQRGEVRPFYRGAGVLASRSGARVLLVWISGTPETDPDAMSRAFITPSRSRVVFVDLMDFTGERDVDSVTRRLRERLAEASGWRINDEPMPPLRRSEPRPPNPALAVEYGA